MLKDEIKILLVDDEPDILEIVGYNLKKQGYQIFTTNNGEDAVKVAKKITPHLIILDVMMPKMDGIETCKIIRNITKLDNTIITFFTAKNEDYAQLAGLEAGADDYITKPVKPKILISKVNALLRRLQKNTYKINTVISIGDLIIDRDSYHVQKNNEIISLPRKEFELLFLLASEPNKVFKREQIMNTIWGTNVIVGDRTIDVHIRKLRKKIGVNYFQTIKGVGYKFVINEI